MNLPWYIPVIIAFLGGFLIGWQGCERDECPECETIEIVNKEVFPAQPKIAVKSPEIKKPVKKEPINQVKWPGPNQTVSKEKYDSLATAYNALSTYRTYVDSISFTNLIVTYKAETEGYLNDIDIGIIDNRPTLTKTVTIRPPAEVKPSRGLYIGATIGGNKEQFSNLGVGLDYVAPKVIIGANYNLMDQTVNVKFGRKLF